MADVPLERRAARELMGGGDSQLVDSFGRRARKLRLSVTDRCNFRCFFCMPTDPKWLPRESLLTYEEIARLVRLFARLGISKVRITGGEPLLRRDIETLVAMLRQVPGIESVTLTTNGFFLPEKAAILRAHGLHGVTVSLHSLKADRFEALVRTPGVLERVLAGIRQAREVGLPVKINCVVIRGCNEDEVLDFARLAYVGGVTVRFIEYMPFDGERQWAIGRIVSGREIIERIRQHYVLVEVPREPGSTARLYRFADGAGAEVGIIASVTQPFCDDCDRVRMTSDGKVVPCMFSTSEYDLLPLLRGGAPDEEVMAFICAAFQKKAPGVAALLRDTAMPVHVRPMHTLGG